MNQDPDFRIVEERGSNFHGRTGRFDLSEAFIQLSRLDNVAVARIDLARGCEITFPGGSFCLQEDIPFGHKVALRPIAAGEEILKYSQPIGIATARLEPGAWVHSHNIKISHSLGGSAFAIAKPVLPMLPDGLPRTFLGYRRSDGRVGTRNFIAIVAVSNCSSHAVVRIAREFENFCSGGVDGIVALPHQEGCAHHEGPDTEQLRRTVAGMVENPNVGAVLMVGLGCEVNHLSRYLGDGAPMRINKPVAALEIQGSGGTLKTIAAGAQKVREFISRLEQERRADADAGHLLLGLNCGGSDAFSGVSANPALGYASDLLVAAGGGVVLAETPEIYGAEQVLIRRAIDQATGERLIHIINRFQDYLLQFGATMDSNPAPGNRKGGISNIVEKSLGAVTKGGTTMLRSVVDYAQEVTVKGLTVMDTPGYDPVSVTGIAAGGCNIIAFTTGRGSAIGFPTVPVLKIASNSRVFHSMADNMDVNAGEIVDGACTIEEKGIEIYRHILRIASGERTKSEILGVREFVPWRIGPTV